MRRFSPAKRNFESLNEADQAVRPTARIIPRAEHSISRSAISPNALRVLYRLREAGYEAFLVGGCVRDLLIGITPKDFDIATSALPEEVKRTFRNCRLIGRRFSDPAVQQLMKLLPYEVVADPSGNAAVRVHGQVMSPADVASHVKSTLTLTPH